MRYSGAGRIRSRHMKHQRQLTGLLGPQRAARVLSAAFLTCFALYSAAAIIFLAAGFAPFLARTFPELRTAIRELADADGTPVWIDHVPLVAGMAAGVEVMMYRSMEPPAQVILQYLFSLLNLILGVFLIWLRPRDWAARLLALGMIGTGAVFNLQAHSARVVLPALGGFAHDLFHQVSGVAYVYGLLLFPAGKLPHRSLAWWIKWPLRVLYLSALAFVGLSFSNAVHGDPEGLIAFFGVIIPLAGITAQVFRYRHAANPLERQQSKALIWALGVAFGATLLVGGLTLGLNTVDSGLSAQSLLRLKRFIFLAFPPLFAVIPVTLFVVMLRYRLWDIDVIINRTLVYSALTGTLALVYVGSVLLLHQQLFAGITLRYPQLVLAGSALLIAALFLPLRRRVQTFIDRRFDREKVDFRRAFADFAREVRTIIDLSELAPALVNRTTELLHVSYGAVFLCGEDGILRLAAGRGNNAAAHAPTLPLNEASRERLQAGSVADQPKDAAFPLLTPLRVTRASGSDLVGVLALGPRRSGQRYSSDDQSLLMGLADQAGAAIHVARLIDQQQADARLREETERRLDAYRASPAGRAETAAQVLLARPETALGAIHRLVQEAGDDPAAAALLDHVPEALHARGATLLAGLATGYHFIFRSRSAPVFLPVGLGGLIECLERPSAAGIEGRSAALMLFQRCRQAVEVGSIGDITRLLDAEPEPPLDEQLPFLDSLGHALQELCGVAEGLRATERVDTRQDTLAYLAGAVERLSRVDHLARSGLGSAEQPIVQRIVENWLAIVTGAMRDAQTRAELVCRLLTRQVPHDQRTVLALSLRNVGRGAAMNIRAGLAHAPNYLLVEEPAPVERLNPGEEVRVELGLEPCEVPGPGSAGRLSVHGSVWYDDPRGPGQVEQFAGVVSLLPPAGPFQFIPNPYVVGTPLRAGSPLFVGREAQVASIQEHLHAAHHNNLVLVGQRRTGKTSLLKQLLARLNDTFVPIYLDGQALGLDPGLPNFFLTLATEISFALDDRGFSMPAPEPRDFADRPAAVFERDFLALARKAIGPRHLLLLIDEFEELEAAVRRGTVDASIFSFLRHLIQHTDGLSAIFCGTHRIEELAADYWSVLFNISLYRHIGFLEQTDALRLIQEPVAPYGLRYDDLALDKMWRMTAGHPYFLQMLCHGLVRRHNRTRQSYVTIADVNAALDEIVTTGEAHLVYLWAESTPDERLALAALSRLLPAGGQAPAREVVNYLAERGERVEPQAINVALERLARRDVLITGATGDDFDAAREPAYGWRLGLLARWVEQRQSLSRAGDGARR